MTIAQQIGRISATTETNARAAELTAIAKFLMLGKGRLTESAAIASDRRANDRVLSVLKDATAGSLADPNFAGVLAGYGSVAAGFVESLRNVGVFDAMFPAMTHCPLRTRIRTVIAAATGTVVAEGSLKPLTELTLAGSQLEPLKATCVVGVTAELLKSTSLDAHALLQRELQSGVVAATDSKFLEIATAGASTTTSSGDARADISALLQALTTGARSKLFLLTGSAIAKTLPLLAASGGAALFPGATVQGGEIVGAPVLVSDSVAAGSIVAVDAAGFCAANEIVTLDSADQVALAMDPAAPSVLTSFWQLGLVALRAERWFGVQKIRDDCVAVIENADYATVTI